VSNRSVLAIFAHPDDAELGCFGTLAGLGAAGYDLHILALTDGSSSCATQAVMRPLEAKESAGMIGANLVIEDFIDGDLVPNRATYACIADHLSRIRPAVVLTHRVGAQDHQDHDIAGRAATTMAMRDRGVRMILQAEPPLMNHLFTANFYVDVTPFMDMKLAAVARYRSEAHKPFARPHAIRDRGVWWARQAEANDIGETRYYEAFYAVKTKIDPVLMGVLSGMTELVTT
jgi:LmbE family N-acetylglucosaminyl deacetylase